MRATDAGGLSFDKSFTIAVGNVNEAPVGIELSNSSIDENSVDWDRRRWSFRPWTPIRARLSFSN